MVARAAPTPGRMMRSAVATSAGVAASRAGNPRCSKAYTTLGALPAR